LWRRSIRWPGSAATPGIVKTDGDAITLVVSNFGIRGDPASALRIAVPQVHEAVLR
jgi:hypothetical protein